jgi:hypothetical protein
MILAIIALCMVVLLAVYFLGMYRGRNIEAAVIARALRVHSYVNQEMGKAYMTLKTDVLAAETKALARLKRFL